MPIPTPTDLDGFGRLVPFRSVPHERRVEYIAARPDLDFDRPFWHMTMEGVKAENRAGTLDKVSLSFDELRAIVGAATPRPAGLIFHVGRCGSTLVSRMIGHDPRRMVIRESSVLSGLHRAARGTDRVPTFTLEQAYKDTLVTFDRLAESRGQQLLVKHSSWESFSMGRTAEILPGTPLVFVYRNPLETVQSLLDTHPGWAPRLREPASSLRRWVPWLEHLDPPFTAATIYAAIWASGVKAALDLDPAQVLLVDYERLCAEPVDVLASLVAHLNLDLDLGPAIAELGQYSKANSDGVPYDPSGQHQHPPLSDRTSAHVLDIVGDLPDRLAGQLALQSPPPARNDKGIS